MSATQVPTNGFITPPQVSSTPAAPATSEATPQAPAGNGNPITLPGQVPGFVPKAPPQPAATQAAAPAEPQAQQLDIAALIQQALGKPEQQAPAATPAAERPAWMPQDLNKFDESKITDPIIKSMAGLLRTVGDGLDLDRVLGNALAHGDPALVDVSYLIEKGGAKAQELTNIAKGIVTAVQAQSAAIMRDVHSIAGGESQWALAANVFNTAAPQELRLVVQQMLDSTDAERIKAGAKIVSAFAQQSGKLPRDNGLMQPGAAVAGAANGLSKVQFQSELQKLDPNAADYTQRYNDLYTRRALGKAAGL